MRRDHDDERDSSEELTSSAKVLGLECGRNVTATFKAYRSFSTFFLHGFSHILFAEDLFFKTSFDQLLAFQQAR